MRTTSNLRLCFLASLCALLLSASSVQVGSATSQSRGKWATNDGDGRLVLSADNSGPTTGRWSLTVKDWRNRRDAGVPIEIVEGNRSRSWFFRDAQEALDLRNIPDREGPATATVKTEAGDIELNGIVKSGKASGNYRFIPHAGYSADAAKILGRALTDSEMM